MQALYIKPLVRMNHSGTFPPFLRSALSVAPAINVTATSFFPSYQGLSMMLSQLLFHLPDRSFLFLGKFCNFRHLLLSIWPLCIPDNSCDESYKNTFRHRFPKTFSCPLLPMSFYLSIFFFPPYLPLAVHRNLAIPEFTINCL